MSEHSPHLDKADRAIRELREGTRAAHEAAQELRAVLKQARAMVDQYAAAQVQAVLDEYTQMAQRNADRWHADWKADAQHHMDRAAEAMRQIVTVVEMNFGEEDNPQEQITADVVIDLRGQVPQWLLGTDPAAVELLKEAPYKVVVGPANQPGAHRA